MNHSISPSVLVTGAHGFLGSAVVRYFQEKGWNVYPAVRRKRSEDTDSTIELDFHQPDRILDLQRMKPLEAIVHLAADISMKTENISDLYTVNVLGTGNLAWVAKKWGAHFIFASTCLIGGSHARQMGSKFVDRPDIPYACSKLMAEELIKSLRGSSAILRLPGLFGYSGPSHLGLNQAITLALQGQSPTLIGKGTAKRNYLFVEDAAADIVYAADQKILGRHWLGGSHTLSIAAMLTILCDVIRPGQKPLRKKGIEAKSQTVERSSHFPKRRSFREAIGVIKEKALQCV